ncbi:MAG TPA: alpha/beta hydrolase [Thermodesulfobacteriota bacterium]|nr:alpha/beta hydrolase [Thermodesulfobacteriota bacterium]
MEGITHRTIETNGIRMHIAECGEGPLVLLCHGFPETWYSWRLQLPAIAAAGFHAVAPDQRGYGGTDQPEPVEAYDIFQLTGDLVGLVNALGQDRAAVVGHDWGSVVTYHCGLFRPDLFRAAALLSVPFLPYVGGNLPPTQVMKKIYAPDVFYQVYFQDPGRAEEDMEADVHRTLLGTLHSLSGSAPPEKRWRFVYRPGERLMDTYFLPESLPAWLSEEDLGIFCESFQRTGFRGGLNWYRNIDRNWSSTPFLAGAKLRQPALFIAGEADPVLRMYRKAIESLERNVPDLKGKNILPGAGHWVNQERAAEVNDMLIGFLKSSAFFA